MKFEFGFDEISGTINGAPITIDGTKVSCEISAQELATYGGVITSVLDQFKDIFKPTTPTPAPMSAPAAVVNVARRPTPSPSPTSTVNVAVESNPVEAAPAEKSLDIKATFDSLEKNLTKRGWSSDKLGNLHWKALTDDKKFESADITIDSAIRLHCMRRSEDLNSNVHMHIYPNQVYVSGISPYYIERFLKGSDIPGLEYIWPIVKDMEARA